MDYHQIYSSTDIYSAHRINSNESGDTLTSPAAGDLITNVEPRFSTFPIIQQTLGIISSG